MKKSYLDTYHHNTVWCTVPAEYLAGMWIATAEEQRVTNKETAQKNSAETLKTSGMESKTAASSAPQITGADEGIGRPAWAWTLLLSGCQLYFKNAQSSSKANIMKK